MQEQMTLLFFNLGGGEIFVIMMVILLFFGSKRIPEFARSLGKGLKHFRNATNEIQRDITDSVKDVKSQIENDKD